MTKYEQNYQPGTVFHDAFLAGLRAMGSNVRKWAKQHDVHFQNIRVYTTGFSNGPKSKAMREAMIVEIGPELFDALYKKRAEMEAVQ
ncbi:MAG: hypothetical protein EP318_06065 [Rhodobacteraceae bacterium]|nr:MAG: hypothetical protein EP318_06065 [Paracoccaceae bacterium]